MLAEQINLNTTFANTVAAFIKRDERMLYLDRWTDENRIHNSYFIYDDNGIKYYLGNINFKIKSSDCKSFIDNEVIYFLKNKGII
ncbi:MAG TPA: hypothetical protein VK061_10270 [Bacillota bacterium]|nr:hypothetical protein [Bacillota bacterium]